MCSSLARQIAADGEGASWLITCTVSGARSEESAERLAKSVVGSSWSRPPCSAPTPTGAGCSAPWATPRPPFRPEHVDASSAPPPGEVLVCRQGAGVDFDEDPPKRILTQDEVRSSTWTCGGPSGHLLGLRPDL